jgi:hypothetical protein
VLSLSRHIAPLVFHTIASPPPSSSSPAAGGNDDDGGSVSHETVLAAVAAVHPHAPKALVVEALRILLLQSDICEGAKPHTYSCCNPAAASGAEPLQFREVAM